MEVAPMHIQIFATCEDFADMPATKQEIVDAIKALCSPGQPLEGKAVVDLPSDSEPTDNVIFHISLG